MPISSFSYEMDKDLKIMAIIDRNIGSVPVMRDIDNVVRYICNVNNIDIDDAPDYLWLFCDEDQVWDGYDPITEDVIELACLTFESALFKYTSLRMKEMAMLLENQ